MKNNLFVHFLARKLFWVTNYSRTSISRTPMAHLPWWLIWTRFFFFSPYKILLTVQENKYLGIFYHFFPILSWKCILCVLIRIASTYHYFIENPRHPYIIPFYLLRTNLHGPKDVQVIEVWLWNVKEKSIHFSVWLKNMCKLHIFQP